MNKLFIFCTVAMVIAGAGFWGCNKNETLLLPEYEQARLKSASAVIQKECFPVSYYLVTQKNREVGMIVVSNDENFLIVEFSENGLPVSEVQLWVGTDPSMVPRNKQNVPLPGKFLFKASDYAAFRIPLSDLFEPVPGGSFDGMEVYIFAHAEYTDAEIEGRSEESAWSEGIPFGTTRWGSYSVYTVCAQPKGCFPHTALGGDLYAGGVNYYDNTVGGAQAIQADNGKMAGTVIYISGTLSFSFNQEWMFTDLLPAPSVVVSGYTDFPPGSGAPVIVFEGEPTYNQQFITVEDLPFYDYYKIELKLQECY